MIACDSCAQAREWSEFRQFNPACIWCGARYWHNLGHAINNSAAEISRRRRGVLATWADYGHDLDRLQRLAKGSELPLEPETKTPKGKGRGKA